MLHDYKRVFGFIFFSLLLFHIVILFIIVGSELFGFLSFEQAILDFVEAVYRPVIQIFFRITPSAWASSGNVLVGFMSILFSAFVYSTLLSIIAALVYLCVLRAIKLIE